MPVNRHAFPLRRERRRLSLSPNHDTQRNSNQLKLFREFISRLENLVSKHLETTTELVFPFGVVLCLIPDMENDKNNKRNDKNIMNAVVANRPRQPGRHYKLSAGNESLAFERMGQPYVDRAAMSARAVISTATVDRVGDVLIPTGCQLANFSKNPVVLWAHGLEGSGRPIATSRDPNGNIAVTISEDEVQATSWFSQSSLEASQVFELIDEGIVCATSVRETPIKSHLRHDPIVGDVLIVEEWDLEEWSWCAVGINPDAVAKTLHRNRLGGHPIIPSIRKSLTSVAPTLRRFGVGLPVEMKVTDPTQTTLATDPTDGELPAAWDDDLDSNSQPYGATVVSAVHASLASTCQNIIDALGPLENPTVKDGLQAILSSLQEQLVALEGLYASSYPNQSQLKSDSDDDHDDDSEAMKAFLASGKVASLQVVGLSGRLKGLIGARNLTPIQRGTLKCVTQQLASLVSQAKSQLSQSDDAKVLALQTSIRELTGLVSRLNK